MATLDGVALSDFPSTQPVTDDMRFVATFDNGDGTFTDYNVTTAQLMAFVGAQAKQIITITTLDYLTATTITNAFFSNTITEITTNGQSYIVGVDFTQSGTVITGVTISFALGQVLIAKV